MRWQIGRHVWSFDAKPVVRLAGVLNVTPDSFSDGGRFVDLSRALEHALKMVEAGADLIDIGGESSRPGAEPISSAAEVERVAPVVAGLRARSDVVISVDTTKASVARAAIDAGADVINDISGLSGDPEMAPLAAERGVGVVLMHMRGTPATMQRGDLSAEDIVADVVGWLERRVDAVCAAGVAREAIAVDPGLGFGKTIEQNLELIGQLSRLRALGRPVMVGASRKSFIGALTERPVEARAFGTAAAHACAVWQGADVLRVHDVGETRDVVAVTRAIRACAGGR